MKCIEISAPGALDVLRVAERPVPQPGAGQVLIRCTASGINRPDVVQRRGHYPPPPGASDLPGLEVAGVIEAGDAAAMAANGLAVGARVCALLAGGGYAQYCVADAAHCLPVPAGLSDEQAAGLPETFFTVWSNVVDRARLRQGETLLVHGGTSGIGTAAIQMGRALGARVIVTCGSNEKCARALECGAHYAINYRTKDFAKEAKRLTDGRGVDVILDVVAGSYVAREVECLAADGRLLVIAIQGGGDSRFDAVRLLVKRLTIAGSTLRARDAAFKARIASALRQDIWPLLESGAIRPFVHAVFPALEAGDGLPNGAARAHALMESGAHVGKIVLSWKEEGAPCAN